MRARRGLERIKRRRTGGLSCPGLLVALRRSLTPILTDGPHSALQHIENRSHALLGKGTAARLLDKGKDSKEVTKLINGLREAISHYQVSRNWAVASGTATHTRGQISQQQDIYHQVTNLAVSISWCAFVLHVDYQSFTQTSFNTLLKLHEVVRHAKVIAAPADA